jgi:hypothetical protein
MQDREGRLGAEEPFARPECERLAVEEPAALPGQANVKHLVAAFGEPVAHGLTR